MRRMVVYLVHGTWPRGAVPLPRFGRARPPLWFEEGSAFREAVGGRIGGEAEFIRFDWSGRNSARARARAAERLAEQIARTAASEPDARQVVIAHSHGGNVAARAAALLPPGSRPVGIATLATPFLHVRGRSLGEAEQLMVWPALITLLIYGVVFPVLGLIPALPLPGALVGVVTAVYCSAYFFAVLRGPASWRRLRETILGWQGDGPPADLDMLILRSPGDEASLALASAGFFTLASRLLWSLLALPVRVLGAVLGAGAAWLTARFGRHAVRNTALGFVSVVLILAMADQAFERDDDPLGPGIGPEDGFVFWALMGVFFSLMSVLAIGVFAMLVVPPLLAVAAVLLLPFGFEFAALGPSVEVSAESVPAGRWAIELLPPADIPAAGAFGRHGIHAHHGARARVADWLSSLLARGADRA